MSGFVAGFGKPDRRRLESAFRLIEHRGTYVSGILENNKAVMAQNYLRADRAGDDPGIRVPVTSSGEPSLAICYDGQVGNWDRLPLTDRIEEESLREERLILELFREYGTGLFKYLNDAIFAFVIFDGERLLAARDLLGIKTLFYGWKGDTLYLSSELKSIRKFTEDVFEFPAGHYMDEKGNLTRYAELPPKPLKFTSASVEEMTAEIRDIIDRSFKNRVDLNLPFASLLSGGIDSSVICCLASRAYKESFGDNARLKTFALGVGESEDIRKARLVASHCDTDHKELIVGLEDLLEVLPDVIYYLESFDPSLVRSSVSNFLISRFARDYDIEALLSGEGGDEVFCGYLYLKSHPPEDLYEAQLKCLGFLHSNASLRLDRMNQCNSVRVVTPLISGELLDYSLRIPMEYKMRDEGGEKIEKWIFRKAFEDDLPQEIVWRLKQEFSQGSGSAAILPGHFEEVISDEEFEEEKSRHPVVRSKEELYYFRIFSRHFGTGRAVDTVGQWVSL